jgi:hypothetical protein
MKEQKFVTYHMDTSLAIMDRLAKEISLAQFLRELNSEGWTVKQFSPINFGNDTTQDDIMILIER